MIKKGVLRFVNIISFFCANWMTILSRVKDRDGKYLGIPLYKLDVDTTKYKLLPFFLNEVTFDYWKMVIINSEFNFNRPTHIYVFSYKGELIHDADFKLFLGGPEEELDEFLDMMRHYLVTACIDYMLDNKSYWKGFGFFLLISDRDIKNTILNEG